ncbi:MAG TPA: hypothetical protein VLZ75_07165 [Chitinophagales bacterium]|nr:hypothetical protein [Chitinophagales bacterium]
MHTIKLKINDKVFDRLIWFLSKFSKDEVEIIEEDTEFIENQKYLKKEFDEILSGNATFLEMDEVEARLEKIIKRNEDNL